MQYTNSPRYVAYNPSSPQGPPKRESKVIKVLAGLLVRILVPVGSYLWVNGGAWDFCTGRFGRWFPEACPQSLDPVTDEQAARYAWRLVRHIDGGHTTNWVYDTDMMPRAGRTADQEKQSFGDQVGRVDHMEYLGGLTRKARGNDFTFNVLSWTTKAGYSFADAARSSFHENLEDEYQFTVHLTALSRGVDDVTGSLPDYDRDNEHKTHDAPVFKFVKKGWYYDEADEAGGPRTHASHGQLAAICYWVPEEAVSGNTITDTSKVMIRTYVGWVKYSQIEFLHGQQSLDQNWPKDLDTCATTQ